MQMQHRRRELMLHGQAVVGLLDGFDQQRAFDGPPVEEGQFPAPAPARKRGQSCIALRADPVLLIMHRPHKTGRLTPVDRIKDILHAVGAGRQQFALSVDDQLHGDARPRQAQLLHQRGYIRRLRGG